MVELEEENFIQDFQTKPSLSTKIISQPPKNIGHLRQELINKFRHEFYLNPKNILAQNICSRIDPLEVCLVRKEIEKPIHVFQHRIPEARPITNQKQSGRCWIFAALNCIRIPFMKLMNIEDFEFSSAHLFFWDKIERSNYFLHNIIKTVHEPLDGRLVQFLLGDPISDGGQWDMFVNLVLKYGLMPKKCFPETFNSEQSSKLNIILKSKLREFAKELRDMENASQSDLKSKVDNQVEVIYRIVAICLGVPSDTFKWEYYDKSKNYHIIGPITPNDFYISYVQKIFNLENKVCLVNDPRNLYDHCFTIDMLGNVIDGRQIMYNNQPIEVLLKSTGESIKDGEPVWFGCEVSKRFAAKQGMEDLNIHDYNLVFGTDFHLGMNKAERLRFGESAMSHAMTFTGVTFQDREVFKLKVENSWGDERGEKGLIMMTGKWFKEFVFEIVVDRKYLPREILGNLNRNLITLPAWDPMGTLAH